MPSLNNNDPLDREFIDKQVVLQELHISERTLQNWRSKGKLPFYKVGGKIWYKSKELKKLIDDSKAAVKK